MLRTRYELLRLTLRLSRRTYSILLVKELSYRKTLVSVLKMRRL
ncbi:hypothetical protein [Aeromonas phage Akh-2]|nr:hypothetical protein [Aeromonas phage Akh-2]